jgi:hypothetical protein
MDPKDSIIKSEVQKAIAKFRDTEGLECDYKLISEAVCYTQDIAKILEEKYNVTISGDILNINYYCD